MLSSISPVGEHARGQRFGLTAAAYLLGSIIGGGSFGLIVGAAGHLLVGSVTQTTRLVAVGVIALVGVMVDLSWRMPTIHRQVDERWLTDYRGWVYGFGFGAQLGTGVTTVMPSSIVVAMWTAAMVSGRVEVAVLGGLVFAALRAAPLLAAGRVRTVERLRRVLGWMDRVRPTVRRTIPVAQGVVAVVAIGLALR